MRKDNEGNARSLVFVCLERSGQCCLAFLAGEGNVLNNM